MCGSLLLAALLKWPVTVSTLLVSALIYRVRIYTVAGRSTARGEFQAESRDAKT